MVAIAPCAHCVGWIGGCFFPAIIDRKRSYFTYHAYNPTLSCVRVYVCATMPVDGFVYFVYYVYVSEQASARAYATIDETCTMSLFNYNNYAVKNEALNQIVFLARMHTNYNEFGCLFWAQGRNSAKQSFAQEGRMPYRILSRAHAHTLKSIRLRPRTASTHNKNLQFSFVRLHDNIR